ncbi:hypothetical protein HELRODRAFT_112421 [Helobdella robusta]|uniref:Fibrinogen C-terminal domain-containing protein n=1 Tax=Helobdella robusta TaxID=6412 RepID=T1EFJ7_HELRO|nr:hypothetical protein HELRODRAFT_112421 [Helobdella robusta]ESO03071.1 hypothetical protein HELRODRAFT_112421 [Helobdella robusta]
MAVPLESSNKTNDCLIKHACATTDDNNVISIATSLYDVQYENQWNNYSDTMLAKCAWSCRTVDQCVGFNFRNSRTASGDGVFCHLLLTRPMLYLSRDDCVYYQAGSDLFIVNSSSIKNVTDYLRTVDNLIKFRKLSTCTDENDQTARRVKCSELKFFNSSNVEERCSSYLGNSYWTPIQRRMDGSINFYRNWTDYQLGFGNKGGEFWIGNEKLYQMTTKDNYKLLVVMEDFNNVVRCALYDTFKVDSSSSYYTLTIGGYSGDAGPALQNDQYFSTFDYGGNENLAILFKGGWWYPSEPSTNLNAVYSIGHQEPPYGIYWSTFNVTLNTLKFTEMKIAIV